MQDITNKPNDYLLHEVQRQDYFMDLMDTRRFYIAVEKCFKYTNEQYGVLIQWVLNYCNDKEDVEYEVITKKS